MKDNPPTKGQIGAVVPERTKFTVEHLKEQEKQIVLSESGRKSVSLSTPNDVQNSGCCQVKGRCQDTKYLILMTMIGTFFLVELIVSSYSGSLALQTDAFHMLADLLALGIGYLSYRLTLRKKSARFTYGWTRAEVIGSLINSVFLIALCFSVLIELIHRIISLVANNHQNSELAAEIDLVLIVAGIGLGINLIGLCLFHEQHEHSHHLTEQALDIEETDLLLTEISTDLESSENQMTSIGVKSEIKGDDDSEEYRIEGNRSKENRINIPESITEEKQLEVETDKINNQWVNWFGCKSSSDNNQKGIRRIRNLNQHAVFLHILGDTLGSIAVILSSLAIKYWDWIGRFYSDPLVSLLMIIIISVGAGRLLVRCVSILLHQTPSDLDLVDINAKISQITGVVSVHEFHIWSLSNRKIIASLHVTLSGDKQTASDQIVADIKTILHQAGVHVSIVQPEWQNSCLDPRCLPNCSPSRCCPDDK